MRPLLVLCAFICAISATTQDASESVTMQADFYEKLQEAVIQGNPQRVSVLLEGHEVELTPQGYRTIQCGFSYESEECLELLLSHLGRDLAFKDGCRLSYAARNGQIARVKCLLDNGADPSFGLNQPLLLAAKHGHVDCVKLLLADPRASPGAVIDKETSHNPETLPLIERIEEYESKDLEDLRKADLTILSADELAILISRKRSDSDIQKHLVDAYLPHLADSATLHAIPGLDTVIMAAISKGHYWPDELRKVVNSFMNYRTMLRFVYY